MNLPPELIETLLTRSSAQILSSTEYESADKTALFELNRLTQHYLTFLIQRIHSFSKTNRRQRINHDDLELAFLMEKIDLSGLEAEIIRLNGPIIPDIQVVDTKVAKGFESIDKKVQNALLGPDLNGRKRGIPGYMERAMILPALPPLYTHYSTPVFVERLTSSSRIKFEASTQARGIDDSLQRIIELSEQTDKVEAIDVDSDEEDGINDVMLHDDTYKEKQRRELFKQCWQAMGFGDVVQGKAVHWRPTIK